MKKLLILAALTLAAGLLPAQAQNTKEVRRVVTGLDASGKAVAIFDSAVPLATLRSPNPAGDMWITSKSPTDYSAKDDWAKTNSVGVSPPKGGTIFRIVESRSGISNAMWLRVGFVPAASTIELWSVLPQ